MKVQAKLMPCAVFLGFDVSSLGLDVDLGTLSTDDGEPIDGPGPCGV